MSKNYCPGCYWEMREETAPGAGQECTKCGFRMPPKVKIIVWFSRHTILAAQEAGLREIFGEEVRIIIDVAPFDNAQNVVERYNNWGAQEMVIVAPLSVIQRLCEKGIRPIRPVMDCMGSFPSGGFIRETDVLEKGRHYRFRGFERIREIRIVTEPLP